MGTTFSLGVMAVVALVIVLCWPAVKGVGRLCLRTVGGLITLFLINPLAGLIGVHLGVNLCNALILGVLGVPGFGLLLLVHWMV